MIRNIRTPKRLKRDNFDLERYIEKAAELDVKCGFYERNDYLGQNPTYIKRRNALLAALKDINEKNEGEQDNG